MRIYKYALEVKDQQDVPLPRGARILSIQAQHERLCVWALVDETDTATEVWRFSIVGTGHPAKHVQYVPFIGTVQMLGGGLVELEMEDGSRWNLHVTRAS